MDEKRINELENDDEFYKFIINEYLGKTDVIQMSKELYGNLENAEISFKKSKKL